MMSRENECIINRAVEGVLGWWPVERALWHENCLSYASEGRKEGRNDGRTDNDLLIYRWSAATEAACLPCHMHAKKERTDIHAHNVKSECNTHATWRSCRLRDYFGCWVERGASPMESAVWGYFGCWVERGASCMESAVWGYFSCWVEVRFSCTPRKHGYRRLRQKH
jgi:hypothetical protein